MGVVDRWCGLWSSTPVWGVQSFLGGFDSYVLPPVVPVGDSFENLRLFILENNWATVST